MTDEWQIKRKHWLFLCYGGHLFIYFLNWHDVGLCFLLEWSVTANQYKILLTDHLDPVKKYFYPERTRSFPGWLRPHPQGKRLTEKFNEDENDVNVWPVYSPDEHLLKILLSTIVINKWGRMFWEIGAHPSSIVLGCIKSVLAAYGGSTPFDGWSFFPLICHLPVYTVLLNAWFWVVRKCWLIKLFL